MKISITELDDHLKKTESGVHALRPDCEKKIVWASESGVKTSTSVVFIHGFSATRFECSPSGRLGGPSPRQKHLCFPHSRGWLADVELY